MSRGFKITRQSDLTERDSNLAGWLKEFAATQEKKQPTVVDAVRSRNSQSLVQQITNIMANKPRYSSVDDAVKDMRERTGLNKYLDKLSADDETKNKVNKKASDEWYAYGHRDGKSGIFGNDILAGILSHNNIPSNRWLHYINGFTDGCEMTPEVAKFEIKQVFDYADANGIDLLKKTANKKDDINIVDFPMDDDLSDDWDLIGNEDNESILNYYDKQEIFLTKYFPHVAEYFYNEGVKYARYVRYGEPDLEDQDVIINYNYTVNYIPAIYQLDFAKGFADGMLMSEDRRSMFLYIVKEDLPSFKIKEKERNSNLNLVDYFLIEKLLKSEDIQSYKKASAQLPETLSKYTNIADDIEAYVVNNIRNGHSLAATVPQLQHDLLALFGVRFGLEPKDVMNEEVAQYLNNKILEERSHINPEPHKLNIGKNVGKIDMDEQDNQDIWAGLLPNK